MIAASTEQDGGSRSFAELLALVESPDGSFVGHVSPTPWGAAFGGELVAQALVAAARTVDPALHAHSLLARYLRPGDPAEPIAYAVERVRDGRSFATREIRGGQSSGPVVTVSAGFHVAEADEDLAVVRAPAAPPPETLPSASWSPHFDRRYAAVDRDAARLLAWTRLEDELGQDPLSQACALAFMADDLPDDAVSALVCPDREPGDGLASQDPDLALHSIDVAVWFHRPISEDGWRLHELRCVTLANACAMVLGEVFDAEGRHLATLGQQVLVRRAGSGR